MQLTLRQKKIIEIVKEKGPITSERIAAKLSLTRATLRPDLSVLTMVGILEAKPRVGYYHTEKPLPFFIGDELRQLKVRDIKSRPVVARDDATIYDAVVTMVLEDVGTLIIVEEGGFLAGVVSRKDLLKITLGQADIHKVPVGIVMTRSPNVVTISPEESVYEAARKMVQHQVDGLPVVVPGSISAEEEEKKAVEGLEVVGRVTKTNITKIFVELGAGIY
ncbi:MAG: CBS domain-containing protein [Firmicutes bacterium]|nr:CBS domain-containing protein [Bacillota bacterium]